MTLISAPIKSIIGREKLDVEVKKSLLTVDKNTDFLIDLLNELLEFKKVESGTYKLSLKEVRTIDFIEKNKNNRIVFVVESSHDNRKAYAIAGHPESEMFTCDPVTRTSRPLAPICPSGIMDRLFINALANCPRKTCLKSSLP